MWALRVAQLGLPARAGLALLGLLGSPAPGPRGGGDGRLWLLIAAWAASSAGGRLAVSPSAASPSHTARSLKACPLACWSVASTADQVLSDFSSHWSPISGHVVCGQQDEAESWFPDWVVILVPPEQEWDPGFSCPICRVGLKSVSSCRGPRTGRKNHCSSSQ